MKTIGAHRNASLLTIVAATHALRLAGLVCGWLECMRRHHIDLLVARRHMGACGCENGRHRYRCLWCVWSRWIRCAGTARCERLSRRVQHMLLYHWRAAGGAAGASGTAIACCRATARGRCCATGHSRRLVRASSSHSCACAGWCTCCGCVGSDASGCSGITHTAGRIVGRHRCLRLGRHRLQRLRRLCLLLQYARRSLRLLDRTWWRR